MPNNISCCNFTRHLLDGPALLFCSPSNRDLNSALMHVSKTLFESPSYFCLYRYVWLLWHSFVILLLLSFCAYCRSFAQSHLLLSLSPPPPSLSLSRLVLTHSASHLNLLSAKVHHSPSECVCVCVCATESSPLLWNRWSSSVSARHAVLYCGVQWENQPKKVSIGKQGKLFHRDDRQKRRCDLALKCCIGFQHPSFLWSPVS